MKILSQMLILALVLSSSASLLLARDITRNITGNQYSTHLQSQRAWVEHLMSQRANAGPGVSYIDIIPLVFCSLDPGKTQDRTNVGINNFSQGSVYATSTDAYVEIYLYDKDGNRIPATSGGTDYITRTVKANQMTQISNIVSTDPAASAFNIGSVNPFYGWLLIYSDQPVTAWASLIHSIYTGNPPVLTVDDPSVELAVADQIYKPAAFMEKTGTRLAILSTIKSTRWISNLSVANVGTGDGNLTVKFYDSNGNEVGTRVTASIKASGVYFNPDIRNGVPDYGMMVLEVADANSSDSGTPRIVANSIVRNVTTGDASFFEAFALPPIAENDLSVNPPILVTRSMAGVWSGSLTGTSGNVSCNVTLELFQERDQIYGTLHIDSGTFPAVPRDSPDDYFLISGEVNNDTYLLQVQDPFDKNLIMFSLRMWAASIPAGSVTMNNQSAFVYFDENNKGDMGSFTLTRTGDIY